MARAALITFVLVSSTLLAGCAGGASKSDAEPEPSSIIEASADAGDGASIVGNVVDDSIAPIRGATVALIDLSLEASTDDSGRYEFRNLAEGTYKIAAQKLGYDSVIKSVEVKAGEEKSVQLMLAPIAIVEAFVDVFPFKLFMACGTGLIAVTVTYGSALCPPQVFGTAKATQDVNVTQPLQSLIGEMKWRQTSAFSAKTMRLDVGKDESGGSTPSFKYPYARTTAPSPIQIRADEPFDGLSDLDAGEKAMVRYRIWVPFQSPDPPIVMLVFQQSFDVYSSAFYGDPAPETYTALPDA